jgi:hypothetical protein
MEAYAMCPRPFSPVSIIRVLVCLLALPALLPADSEGLEADLALLREKEVKSDGASLLDFFKKRTMSEPIRKMVAGLVGKLGDDEFAVREKATTDLIEIGAPARPMLSAALRNSDLEVCRRARRALEAIGSVAGDAVLLPAAARVLAQRKPAGAAEVLLEFLPNIEDTQTAEEVARLVGRVAIDKAGQPERAVLLALGDRQWIKRYAAAEALAGVAGQRAAVRKLLKDRDSGVRRRVAVALLHQHDKEAVPALIALLTEDSRQDVEAAEDMLMALAGDKAPTPPEESTPLDRERYRKQWERWWKDAVATIDLEKVNLNMVRHGRTIIATLEAGTTGRVQEVDSAGKVRWSIAGLRYPVFASLANRNRVLICEYMGNRVTERDFSGRIFWEKTVPMQLLSARRLRNGNTFIVSRNLLLEVDRTGKDVRSFSRPNDVLSAERFDDGTITVVTTGGQCVRLDKAGRQTRAFHVGPVSTTIGTHCCFLPKGGVIVPDYLRSKVREYDASGKVVWEADIARPTSVSRLPNGHTLVASRMRNRIVELDKTGREVGGQSVSGRAIFVERR